MIYCSFATERMTQYSSFFFFFFTLSIISFRSSGFLQQIVFAKTFIFEKEWNIFIYFLAIILKFLNFFRLNRISLFQHNLFCTVYLRPIPVRISIHHTLKQKLLNDQNYGQCLHFIYHKCYLYCRGDSARIRRN